VLLGVLGTIPRTCGLRRRGRLDWLRLNLLDLFVFLRGAAGADPEGN
jgi:hypothetical protein